MAPTSGSRSSARKFFHILPDICCDDRARKNISWFLKHKYLRYAVLTLFVGSGSVLLLLRFVVTAQIKAYVEDARLNSFALAGTRASFSAYNVSISVALAVRNPNGAMDITYTKPLVATFLFDDRRLYNITVVGKGYEHKPLKRELHLLRTGAQEACVLDAAADEEFQKQNATGVFTVEMRLSGQITLGIGNSRMLELSCPLTLRRPPGTDPDVVVFPEVACESDKPKRIIF